ncbi:MULTISPECIES: hypothetical protein [Niastella]|uniref:Uncharacterized protein n=1 Tax=Niastella soli TaxID=2821487 RepID=A0ABS3YUP9_9BACT|nr:hypothetical protein [Niastella soli]MBO9201608.1 hypothetical protein [Niastella soli]
MFNALLYKKHARLYEKSQMEHIPLLYYLITVFLLLSIVLTFQNTNLMLFAMITWLVLTGWLAWKRLRNTSRSLYHIAEMICTSAIIPVLSIYWDLYGAIKFKTLYI